MKKSKFSLILALVIILALVTPFVTYATDTDAQELTTTSETGEPDSLNQVSTDGTDDSTTTDENNSEDSTTTEETLEEITGNYYEINSNLVFNKAVDGNAFLAGDTITIKGKVNGDLYVCANNVTLEKDAQVYGNLFVIADNFTHSGLVYNLFAATTNYTCEYDGLTALDLKVFAENIKFSGYAERTAYFSANKIELTDDAYILGNFVYSSSNEPAIGESATIYGETLTEDMFTMVSGIDNSNQIVDYIISAVTLLGSVLLILLVLNFFKPNALSTNLKFNFVKCLKSLGIGLLSFIVLTLVLILLFLSVIFTQFAVIILFAFILALLLSAIVVIISTAIMLYNKFNKGKSKLFVVLYTILVALVYYALTIIPFAGGIISIVISLTGFGFIVLWLFNIRKLNKLNKVFVEKESEKKTVEAPKETKVVKEISNKEVKEVKKENDKKGNDKKATENKNSKKENSTSKDINESKNKKDSTDK